MSITFSDSITFAFDGGRGIDLDQLVQGGATNGQILAWNNSNQSWEPVDGGISQTEGDARYLLLTGSNADLGDADDIRSRIRGEWVAFNSDRTIVEADYGKVFQFFGSTARTLTLPDINNAVSGRKFFINNNASAALTINPHSTDQLNNNGAGNGTTLQPGEFAFIFLANPAPAGNWTLRKLVDASLISESDADSRYLRLSGVNADLGDADDIRSRIRGENTLFNANRNVTEGDYGSILHFYGSTARTLTLPPRSSLTDGRRFYINSAATAALTINPQTDGRINGGAVGDSFTLEAGAFAVVYLSEAASSNWTVHVLGSGPDNAVEYFSALPSTSGRPDGEIIIVDGEQYELTVSTSTSLIQGEPGGRSLDINSVRSDLYGWVTPITTEASYANSGPFAKVMGEFTHNPIVASGGIGVAALYGLHVGLAANEATRIQVFALVNKAEYEREKGSAIALNDPLSIQIATPGLTSQAVLARHNDSELSLNGVEYAEFQVEVTASTLAGLSGGNTQQQSVFNFFDFLEDAAEDGDSVAIGLYAAGSGTSPAFTPARRFQGSTRGWTAVYDDLEKSDRDRIENLELDQLSNTVIAGKLNDLSAKTADQRVETVGVTWARSTNAQNTGGIYFTDGPLNLAGIQAVAAADYRTSLLLTNETGYIWVRVPHGINPNSARLRFRHTNGQITTTPLSDMWNMGNDSTTTYTYFGFYGNRAPRSSIDPGVNFVDLERSSNVKDVVWHGAFSISTYPDTGGSVIFLTQTQYNGLTDEVKNNGKMYSTGANMYLGGIQIAGA